MKDHADTADESLERVVYKVPGPHGTDTRWIARSVYGQVAHGRTAESAAESLEAGMDALARASGLTTAEWQQAQSRDCARFLKSGERVQA